MTPGDTLSLRISHLMHGDPVFIEQVEVRWVKGSQFAVAFGPLDEAEADRLHRVLDDFLNTEQ